MKRLPRRSYAEQYQQEAMRLAGEAGAGRGSPAIRDAGEDTEQLDGVRAAGRSGFQARAKGRRWLSWKQRTSSCGPRMCGKKHLKSTLFS